MGAKRLGDLVTGVEALRSRRGELAGEIFYFWCKSRAETALFNYLEKRARRDTRGAYTFLPVPVPVPVPACNTRGTWRRNHAHAHTTRSRNHKGL